MARRNDKEGLRAYLKAYRQKHKAHLVDVQRAWRQTENGRTAVILSVTKQRADKKGLPFSLRGEDVVVPEFCPVLGIRLKRGAGRKADNSPAMDRRWPTIGYVPGNIRVISDRANRLKSDCTDPRELAAVAEYVADMYSLKELCQMAVFNG